MLTTFIAAQCFQCSTMQVKQQKKSTNKWTCVVCGEKQSLRKVFAQGHLAKDVRQFVQNFNMSRQLEEDSLLDAPRNEDEYEEEDESERKKRRTDWTEFVADDDEGCGKLKILPEDSEFEPQIVTEMPKALFRKPKLKDYSASESEFSNRNMYVNEVKQTASKRTFKGNSHSKKMQERFSDEDNVKWNQSDRALKWNAIRAKFQDADVSLMNKEPTKVAGRSTQSKWNGYIAEDEDRNNAPTTKLYQSKAPISKWSSFITDEDDEELEFIARRNSMDHISQRNTEVSELKIDERVEDDIHPDFL